jgi:hypothetical protein
VANDPVYPTGLSDAQLIAESERLAHKERRGTVRLIVVLAELDARSLYFAVGCSSLYTYCIERLGLSRDAAYLRIKAAEVARKFPIVIGLLETGALCISTVALLSRHLTAENHGEWLARAEGKSKREVELMLASTVPPVPVQSTISGAGDDQFRLKITLSRKGFDDLVRAQELLQHVIPNRDPALVVERLLAAGVRALERRKFGVVNAPRSKARTGSDGRYVAPATRRAVAKRDGNQCAFVGTAGRCTERSGLEFHHVIAYAKGGPTTINNLQLRCRAHNRYEAEQEFGASMVRDVGT